MKNIVIFGASGHGNVVLDILERDGNFNVVGFIDTFSPKGDLGNGYHVLGTENDLPELINKHDITGGIIAIGDNWTRKKVYDRIRKVITNFNFVSAIHPSAVIGREAVIGRGTVVMPGSVINSETIIGDFCILNTNSSIDHNSKMGDFSSLAPRVSTGGLVTIGEFTAVCLGACIIDGIIIGEHAVIGAGALVIRDVQQQRIAYGSPAIDIRERERGERYLLGSIKRNTTN